MKGDLKQYASEGIHGIVIGFLSGQNQGTVLDAPSGQGGLTKALENLGFKVFAGDLKRENMIYRNGRCTQLDLNGVLPFKDNSFDCAVCAEGIEHLENPHHLIREFSRVLRNEGSLVVTTPNVMTIKSRVRFLFYSYLDFFRYIGPVPPSERHHAEEYDHQHINPIFYPELKFILEGNGFSVLRVDTNRKVVRWRMIHPFLKWFVKLKTSRKYPADSFYTSDTLLEGESLIVVARRVSRRDNRGGEPDKKRRS